MRFRRLLSLIGTAAIIAALAVPSTAAPTATTPCVDAMPLDEVHAGMILDGHTDLAGVDTGFEATVLGVSRDFIAPGKGVIVAELSGPMIDKAGGAWFGMSGSPMYSGGRFVGVVAWAIGQTPSAVVGLTPAQDVISVTAYPGPSADGPMTLPRWMTARLASVTDMSPDDIGTVRPLAVPLAVSGGADLSVVRKHFANEGIRVIPFASGSSTYDPTAAPVTPLPGDGFAAVLSYGQITSAAMGTVSYSCDGQVVSFGHFIWGWFTPGGEIYLSASTADSLGLATSPWGTFEMLQVGEPIGTVDQDRYAGVRALLGPVPAAIPLTVSAYSIENDRTYNGRSDVVYEPDIAYISMMALTSALNSAADRGGMGTATVTFDIRGVDASGDPWSVERVNMFTSRGDIAESMTGDLGRYLTKLTSDRFEDATVTSVDASVSANEEYAIYKLGRISASLDGKRYVDTDVIDASPGDFIYLRVGLKDRYGTEVRRVKVVVQVPGDATGSGELYVGGGSYLDRRTRARSFDDLVTILNSQPRSDAVAVDLVLGSHEELVASNAEIVDRVVMGGRSIGVSIVEGP